MTSDGQAVVRNRSRQPANVPPPLGPRVLDLLEWLHRAWRIDAIRLTGLTLYYLAIIAALIALYGGAEYSPPPFVYQGF